MRPPVAALRNRLARPAHTPVAAPAHAPLLRRRKAARPNRRPQVRVRPRPPRPLPGPGRVHFPNPCPRVFGSWAKGGGMEARFTRGKSALLERALARPRTEVSLSAFALLFSELVQHCQSRVFSVAELQARLAALGRQVGARVLDALVAREKGARRETKVLGALLFVKGAVWKALFGKEADKLEQANDDARTFYIIEREPLINTYISVPKENSTLNCASFTAGIVEAVLTHSGFPAKVTAHWHKGTTLMIKFEEAVIARDRALEGR
uniref:Trafficking protein particle complex subunit 5 n=1 Tax=Bos indicus x Bos taurus TaxID=30522 RepID=A0A4W2HEV4_BOBOX